MFEYGINASFLFVQIEWKGWNRPKMVEYDLLYFDEIIQLADYTGNSVINPKKKTFQQTDFIIWGFGETNEIIVP